MTARELYQAAEVAAERRGGEYADSMYRGAGLLAQIEAAEALVRIADHLQGIDGTLDAIRTHGLHVETGS